MVFHNFISAILQIALFAFIPFIFFLFRKDKSTGYLKYIGFTEPTSKSIVYVCVVATLIAITGIFLILINEGFKQALLSPPSITGQFRQEGMSFNTVCSLLIMACLKTSLSEEILFRGFLAKQLIIKLGFKIGNLIQAAIFGLMHYLLFWKIAHTSIGISSLIFTFSFIAGWIIGYMKEKVANGSIIPGWIAHGIGNTISYSIIAFVV